MNMESLAEKLEYEDLIDPETGEFYDPDFEVAGGPPLTSDHLPKLARRIIHDTYRIKMIQQFKDDELARIRECCNARIFALEKQIDYCREQLAKPVVDGISSRTMELPGLGKFKFRKGREYVEDEAYQEMTPEEQTRVQTQRPGCFKVKTTITPDKKEIKARLEDFKGGRSEADVEGFEIKRHPEVFVFEPEGKV